MLIRSLRSSFSLMNSISIGLYDKISPIDVTYEIMKYLLSTLPTKSCIIDAVITIIDALSVQVSCCLSMQRNAMHLHRLTAMRCGATLQTCGGAYRRRASMQCHQTLLRLLMVYSRRIFNSFINISIINSIILFSIVFIPYSLAVTSTTITAVKFRRDCSDQIHKVCLKLK
uniref:G_PROTEIN_RECEP_F1_2 domain-containing protein n=1 Tax=Ascaris lumbricoides TaxID=6252 RepID=A0A0M3IKN8_ASCLU